MSCHFLHRPVFDPTFAFHVPRHLRCISSWVGRGGGLAKEPDLLTADLLPNFKDVAPSFTSVSPTYTFFLAPLFQPLVPSPPSSLPRDHHDLSPSGSLHFKKKKKTWPSSLPCSCLLQTSCPRSLRTLSIEAPSIVATSSALAPPEILLLWDKTHRCFCSGAPAVVSTESILPGLPCDPSSPPNRFLRDFATCPARVMSSSHRRPFHSPEPTG